MKTLRGGRQGVVTLGKRRGENNLRLALPAVAQSNCGGATASAFIFLGSPFAPAAQLGGGLFLAASHRVTSGETLPLG